MLLKGSLTSIITECAIVKKPGRMCIPNVVWIGTSLDCKAWERGWKAMEVFVRMES